MSDEMEFIVFKMPHGKQDVIQKVAYMIQQDLEKLYPNVKILVTTDDIKTMSKDELKSLLQETLKELGEDNGANRKT